MAFDLAIQNKLFDYLGLDPQRFSKVKTDNKKEYCETLKIVEETPKMDLPIFEADYYSATDVKDSCLFCKLNLFVEDKQLVVEEHQLKVGSIINDFLEKQNKILAVMYKLYPDSFFYNPNIDMHIEMDSSGNIINSLFELYVSGNISMPDGRTNRDYNFVLERMVSKLLKDFDIEGDIHELLSREDILTILDIIAI
jgi:hypothetical protein